MKQVQSAGKKGAASDLSSNEGLLRIQRDLKFIGIRGTQGSARLPKDAKDRRDLKVDFKSVKKELQAAVELLLEIKGFADIQKKDFEECREVVRGLKNEVFIHRRFTQGKGNYRAAV